MDLIDRRHFLQLGAAASATALPKSLWAQTHLPRARILIGFPAGDPSDVACRLFAERMKDGYASTIVVDNRPGAGGRLAVQEMSNVPQDGSTMLFSVSSILSLYPHIYKSLPYDSFNDLVPVSRAATFTYALTIGPMVPDSVKTVPQFLAWCKTHPHQASYGSAGEGTSPHFMGAILGRSSGVPLTHIPYRGAAQAMNEVIAGQVAAAVTSPAAALPHAKSGRARILAVTSPVRWSQLPDIPTMTEEGFPQVSATEWFGFFMRAGTPAEKVARASEAVQRAAKVQEVSNGLAPFAMEVGGNSSAELAEMLRRDHARWAGVVKAVGFKPQD